ncbi:MAG: hypothetical protein AB9882_04965 [Ignavibacteriaceae bacterium]
MLDDSKREDKNLNSGEKNDSPEKPDIDEDSYHDEDIFPLAEKIIKSLYPTPNFQEFYPTFLKAASQLYKKRDTQADRNIIKGNEPIILTKYLAYKVINRGNDITDVTLFSILSGKTDSDVFQEYDKCLNIIEDVNCAILQFESCTKEIIYSIEKEQINLLNNYPSVLYFSEREYDNVINLNKDKIITGKYLVTKKDEELGRLKEMRDQLEIRSRTLKEKITVMNDLFINNSFLIDSNDDVEVSYSSTTTGKIENIPSEVREKKEMPKEIEDIMTEDKSFSTKKTKLPRKIKKSITKEITPKRAEMYLATIKKYKVTQNIRASCFEVAKLYEENGENFYKAFYQIFNNKFNHSYGQMEESLKELIKENRKKSKKKGNFNN